MGEGGLVAASLGWLTPDIMRQHAVAMDRAAGHPALRGVGSGEVLWNSYFSRPFSISILYAEQA